MGDHIRSKTKLGYHISTKIISILLVLLLTTTAFSSIVVAQGPTDSLRDKIKKAIDKISGDGSDKTGDSDKGAAANAPASKPKISDLFKELSMLKRERTPIFSVVTKYNGTEITTPLKRLLPTAIDVDNDGDKDIRVWVFRFPGIDLRPPAACIKTTLLVRRLNDDIKSGPFEIYLQYTPKILSKLAKTPLPSIRIGYQTPAGEEVPKYCIVTHKNIPHLLYPRLKTTHRIAINPGPAVGKSQLNLIFSIVNETAQSKLTILVNHNPAIKNEISLSLSKDYFIRRGQTLEISRKNAADSNVSLTISDVLGIDSGSLTIKNIPKKITLSWLFAPKGHIELNTYGSSSGNVEANVNGVISLGFKPETGVNFRLGWDVDRLTRIGALIGLKRGKSFDLTFDASASATLSDLYVDVPNFNLLNLIKPQKLKLTASLLSFNLKAGLDAGKLVLKPLNHPSADNIGMDVENLDVVLKNCTVDLETVEVPTVTITSPEEGPTISGITTIKGTAFAPSGKTLKQVQISFDDGDGIDLSTDANGNWYYDWDTKTVLNGDHTIYVQCKDNIGNSGSSSVSVKVVNEGINWYPLVNILTPTQKIVSGVVTVSGTASDKDGAVSKVQISVDDGKNWIDTVGTTSWSYNWDTSSLGGGAYKIEARSYDGTDYTPNAYINSTSKTIFVRFCDILDFNLVKASVDITNLVIKSGIPLANITGLEVSSFVASGTGSLKIGEDTVSLEALGSLDIQDVSISKTNETSVTTTLLDNLDVNFNGYGSALLSKSAISLELNASIYVHVDEMFGIKNTTFGLNGIASAKISFDESGKLILGEDKDRVMIDVKDLVLAIEGIISAGADRIFFSGTGDISIVNNQLMLNGGLTDCILDNFYINTDLGILYLSGSVSFSESGSLTLDFAKSLSFNLSYTGLSYLEITNAEVKVLSKFGNVSASANTFRIYTDGYVDFSYFKNDASAACWVNISEVCFTALSISFNELSVYAGDICGTGSFYFELDSVVTITHGEGWINIIIGGKGMMHIIAHATIYTDQVYGRLDVDVFFNNGNDIFVINISGIPNNITVYMNGSAALDLDDFDLLLRDKTDASDLVNISLDKLDGNFVVHADEGVWTIETTQGISVEKLYFTIFLKSAQTFFSIDVDSIETSGGGRFFIDKENKIISYVSGDDTDKTISLVGLDVIAGLLNVIIEEMDIALSGPDTTISLSSVDNKTKLNIDFSAGSHVHINTLWANILGLVKIRLHTIELSKPITVLIGNDNGLLVTLNTGGGDITAGEFSISALGFINLHLYGVDLKGSGNSVSIGLPSESGISLSTDGKIQLHIDTIVTNNGKILNKGVVYNLISDFNISLNGKVVLKDLGLPLPFIIEADVSELTTLSIRVTPGIIETLRGIFKDIKFLENHSLVFTFEPGSIYINIGISDGFDILAVSTSLITINIQEPISKFINRSIALEGYVEAHISLNSDENENNTDISINGLKIVGLLKISRYRFLGTELEEHYFGIEGNGSGYLSWSKDSDGTHHVVGSWDGYLTFIKTVDGFIDAKTVILYLQDVDIDISFKHDIGGAIKLLWQLLDDTHVGIWKQLIDDTWVQMWPLWGNPPTPPSNGITTLFAGSNIGSVNIIPGDSIDFSAFYVPASITNNIIQWANSMPQSNPSPQSQPGTQPSSPSSQPSSQSGSNNNQGQDEMPGQQNNGQGASPLGYGQDGGQSGTYTFTLNYGDGNSQIFPVDYSDVPVPIKVDLGSHLYTSPGTYTATLTVSGDPDADEVAVDTLTIKVVEKYLDVSTSSLSFDYINVGSDGKIHGSFKVSNLANATYSNGYVLDWSIINKTRWGTNWTFEPSSGSLQPNRSQIVNISFTPPIVKGDYNDTDTGIIIVNNNDPTEMKIVNFSLNYGLIELFPQYPIVLYVDTGGTRTLENVFWVHRTRWEKNDAGVAWEVCESSFAPGMVTFIPDNGVIPKGKGPTPVDLRVTASDGVYKGTVKVCRVDDPSDNDTVDITLVVGMNGQLNIDLVHDGGDKLFENQPFTIHVSDADSAEDVPYATVTYQKYDESEMYETGITDNNGNVEFTSIGVSTSEDVAFCKVNVEATGYDSTDLYFLVWDSIGQIHGFVYDSVTEEGIGNALVTAEPGSYSAYTMPQGASKGRYVLRVPAGTYTVTASKDGYPSETVENVSVGPDGYFFLCFNLTPYNLPPVAEAGGRYSGYVDEPITFDGSGSYDPDGYIAQYDWKWETMGDWENDIGPNLTHIYTTPGYRTISLRVHDNGGSTAEDTAIVTVNKVLKINAPNSVNENEWFTVTVTKRDGSSIVGCFVDFNGETKYAIFGTTSFQAPAVYMNVDKLIHAWQELSDSEAFRYITVINTN